MASFSWAKTLPVISLKSTSGAMSVELMTRATQKRVEQFITRVLKHFVSQREPFSTLQSHFVLQNVDRKTFFFQISLDTSLKTGDGIWLVLLSVLLADIAQKELA